MPEGERKVDVICAIRTKAAPILQSKWQHNSTPTKFNRGEPIEAGGYYASLVARQTRGLIRNEGEDPPPAMTVAA